MMAAVSFDSAAASCYAGRASRIQGRWAISALTEEIAQEGGAFLLPDASKDYWPVMAGRMCKHTGAMIHATALWVFRTVKERTDACRRNGTGTHCTGLQRDIEVQSGQAFSTLGRSCADGQDLGMRSRILLVPRCISRPCDDGSVDGIDDDCTNRHLAGIRRFKRRLECSIHGQNSFGHN